ncbi:MAG: hypothetical protein EHM78_01915 [Myxococcaceae bacterium]|nr:MAG: hypothetical protein EHM78_01915 [Myxococcaceae bacterium]
MARTVTIQIPTGFAEFRVDLPLVDKPAFAKDYSGIDEFVGFRVATLHGKQWLMARGHKDGPDQIVVWYPNGRMWSGYGLSQKEALKGAMENAWRYL